MNSEVFPIIDLSSHQDGVENLEQEIIDACMSWGFMILTGHGIAQSRIDRMFELHKAFCNEPVSVKSECTIDQRQVGYDYKSSTIGVNECMVFGGQKGAIVQGENIPSWWDAGKRAEVEAFKASAHRLGLRLLRVFASHFGLQEDYFSSAHDASMAPGHVLRMLHYPKLETQPDKRFPRLYSHTDWGSLTFVWPQSGGLEVETPSKKWMHVPLIPGGVVVNVGDAMSLWSGKVLKSTLHKISFDNLPTDQDRWSMAYFVNANSDATLEVLKGQNDGSGTKDDGAIVTAGQYLSARQYMALKEDAKNNWVSSNHVDVVSLQDVIRLVEGLGVANGSGTVDFAIQV